MNDRDQGLAEAAYVAAVEDQWVASHEDFIDPQTQKPVHICIDADCPSCHWPERWVSPAEQIFGCPKCPYTSHERES
jgi:hypothetical protein